MLLSAYIDDCIKWGLFDRKRHLETFSELRGSFPSKIHEIDYIEHLLVQASIVRDKIIVSKKNVPPKITHLLEAAQDILKRIISQEDDERQESNSFDYEF